MKLRNMMLLSFAALSSIVGPSALGQGSAVPKAKLDRIVERGAFIFAGRPATAAEKESVLKGEKRIEDLLNVWLESEGFEVRFAEYWSQVLKVDGPAPIFTHFNELKPGRPRVEADYRRACGDEGTMCFPSRAESDRYKAQLELSFAQEPGRFLARLVSSGKPWDESLRGTWGVADGAMLYFLKTAGQTFREISPPESYSAQSALTLIDAADPASREFVEIDRGKGHSGILTTVAFQSRFNGWRAKANAAYEAFMCRKFEVPPGAKQIASSEIDLTRRPYCQSCHLTLEPMAEFFGRWPNLGSTNYFYNPTYSVAGRGRYRDHEDTDAAGLARAFTSQPEFSECAVARAFEFVAGRQPNSQEKSTLLPSLRRVFEQNNRTLGPVFKYLLSQDVFTGVKK